MLELDEFESSFKAASREVYRYERVEWPKAIILTDLSGDETERYAASVKAFLAVLTQTQWTVLGKEQGETVEELLQLLEEKKPDLVCTYRHVHSGAHRWPFSLGTHVDVIAQAAACPLMLLPRPAWQQNGHALPDGTRKVTAITDHLTGNDKLVNKAARLTAAKGTLLLTHVEDQETFERYMDVISKVQGIDTETARQRVLARLLKEPADYIETCARVLREEGLTLNVKPHVGTGHSLSEYKSLIAEHTVDLLVLPGRDEKQNAMPALSYALAIELDATPMLLIR